MGRQLTNAHALGSPIVACHTDGAAKSSGEFETYHLTVRLINQISRSLDLFSHVQLRCN